jgi:hypothetical protein
VLSFLIGDHHLFDEEHSDHLANDAIADGPWLRQVDSCDGQKILYLFSGFDPHHRLVMRSGALVGPHEYFMYGQDAETTSASIDLVTLLGVAAVVALVGLRATLRRTTRASSIPFARGGRSGARRPFLRRASNLTIAESPSGLA